MTNTILVKLRTPSMVGSCWMRKAEDLILWKVFGKAYVKQWGGEIKADVDDEWRT